MGLKDLHHKVYVILLDSEVLTKEKKFRERNPDCVPGWPCLYVGSTGLSREERFANHKEGYKGNKYVKKYGLRLAMEFVENSDSMSWKQAKSEEESLAKSLSLMGYPVWQN